MSDENNINELKRQNFILNQINMRLKRQKEYIEYQYYKALRQEWGNMRYVGKFQNILNMLQYPERNYDKIREIVEIYIKHILNGDEFIPNITENSKPDDIETDESIIKQDFKPKHKFLNWLKHLHLNNK